MIKRTIQTSKPGYTVGIEYDHLAIRVARLSTDGRGSFVVDRLEEFKGNYLEDAALLEGLRQVKSSMNINSRDPVVTCLAGKQVFATQIPFRKLGPEEMEQALRLELRKTVHFEVATSTLDYEIVFKKVEQTIGTNQILVAIAANSLLKRQLSLLEKVGLKADAVDVLPIAVANALWTWVDGESKNHTLIGLHIGPQISTIVIDGEYSPFFSRNLYFSAEDVFGPKAIPQDREKRVQSLMDEVSRSLAFYDKNSGFGGFQEIVLLGDFLDGETLVSSLNKTTGLLVHTMGLAAKFGYLSESVSGRFDLAIALAFRGEA
jgi:Tfp pilus assembly PilM family ATPase